MRRAGRTAVAGVMALAAATAVVSGLVAPASAGSTHEIHIEKVVVGAPPPNASFTIVVSCTNGQVEQAVLNGPGTDSVLVTPTNNTCTVSEPGTGGASSVSFACADDPGASECQSDVVLAISEIGDSQFTVTNTFDPPPPADPRTPPAATPVPGTPRFTG